MSPLQLLVTVLLSLGAIQGLVYGVLLWIDKGKNRRAKRFLSAILFFFAYRLFAETIKMFDIGNYDVWYHILLEYNWIYGALIYFFVLAYLRPEWRFKWKDGIHFLPVVLEFVWSNFIKSQNFYWDGTRESLSWLGYYGYIAWMHYPTMYFIAGALLIYYTFKSERLLTEVGLPDKTKWLRIIVLILRYYALLFIVVVSIDLVFFDYAFSSFYASPMFILMALITYGLGIFGFSKRNEIIIKEKAVLSEKERVEMRAISDKLQRGMMENKWFLDQQLTLDLLAEKLELKSYLLSKCLNHEYGMRFNDYINKWRVEEVQKLINDPKNEQFTLLTLAYQAGFNSKASFNRAVKAVTGKSPSELKQK